MKFILRLPLIPLFALIAFLVIMILTPVYITNLLEFFFPGSYNYIYWKCTSKDWDMYKDLKTRVLKGEDLD